MVALARVLMISSLWPPDVLGGAETYAADLGEQLRRRGHDVMAVTRGVDADDVVAAIPTWPYRLESWAGQPRWRRSAFHGLDQWNPSTAPTVRRAIDRFAPTVVHSHSVTGMSVTALTTPARTGATHVHTLHDYWLLCQRSSLVRADGDACESRCSSCSLVSAVRTSATRRHGPDVVIAPSEGIAREHRHLPELGERIRVVYHPVVPLERPSRAAGPPVFGYIGQLTGVKGVQTLLDAFGKLPPATARLVLAGRGALEPDPGSDAPPGVEFLGWVSGAAKQTFFDSIDCLVVPSEWKEPAPLVINEAKGRSLPVIGSRMGGIPELVPERSQSLLFDAGDVSALLESMRRFAESPDAFPVGPEERAPSWDLHVDQVLRCYDDAARSRRRG